MENIIFLLLLGFLSSHRKTLWLPEFQKIYTAPSGSPKNLLLYCLCLSADCLGFPGFEYRAEFLPLISPTPNYWLHCLEPY
jgi:hypothetical protein